ncbi:MAG: transglutaminase domain-containing protein [Candidatus Aenigmatarchaeota archaeon]
MKQENPDLLKRGMKLPSKGTGHTLEIGGFDGEFRDFYQEFSEYVERKTGKELPEDILERKKEIQEMPDGKKAGLACRFVNEKIDYDLNYVNGKDIISTSEVIERGRGVCKEYAATLKMLYQMMGVESEYVRGRMPNGNGDREGHAVVKAHLDDYPASDEVLADPTNGRFGKYESVSERMDFEEGTSLVKYPNNS